MISHIQTLPLRAGNRADVVVQRLAPETMPLAITAWNQQIHSPYITKARDRADANWDWNRILRQCKTIGVRRGLLVFQIAHRDTATPLAMVVLLADERWPLDHSQPAVFAWYLSGAPSEAVQSIGEPKCLMRAAMDVALTVSLNGKADGRLWLHAAPEGGRRLLEWYAGFGLQPISKNIRLPAFPIRQNDGGYFMTDPSLARRLSCTMDDCR